MSGIADVTIRRYATTTHWIAAIGTPRLSCIVTSETLTIDASSALRKTPKLVAATILYGPGMSDLFISGLAEGVVIYCIITQADWLGVSLSDVTSFIVLTVELLSQFG
jgi:hypothetical protein